MCIRDRYCHDEINYDLVYRTFLEEKKVWDKDSGRMYAHNIISWHKDEQITPEQALEFGKEFAENGFSGFQTLVAVHKDKDHIHCHLVTNSVSYEAVSYTHLGGSIRSDGSVLMKNRLLSDSRRDRVHMPGQQDRRARQPAL